MEADPFELENLASDPKYKKQIQETRKWAEAEIGRPKLAVVGGWNDAYPNMVKSIMKENAHLIPDLLPSEKNVPKWWRFTNRVDLIETCNRSNRCEKKYYAKTGWTKSAVEKDMAALDGAAARMEENASWDRAANQRLNRLMHWASLCGELCCPWRERHGYECKNQYAADPFAYTRYYIASYTSLNNYNY